jgi:hypothetical protein
VACLSWDNDEGALTISCAGGLTLGSGIPLVVDEVQVQSRLSPPVGASEPETGFAPCSNGGELYVQRGEPPRLWGCSDEDGDWYPMEARGITVVPNTTGPVALTSLDQGRVLTNDGAGGSVEYQLPTAAPNLAYEFCVVTAQTLQVTAASGDTIGVGSSTSATAGNITNNVVNACVSLFAPNASGWIARSFTTTWTVN